MLDHGDGTGQPGLVQRALQRQLDSALTRDDILDNITLYWLTGTGVSAARLYWENKASFFDANPSRSRSPHTSSGWPSANSAGSIADAVGKDTCEDYASEQVTSVSQVQHRLRGRDRTFEIIRAAQ